MLKRVSRDANITQVGGLGFTVNGNRASLPSQAAALAGGWHAVLPASQPLR